MVFHAASVLVGWRFECDGPWNRTAFRGPFICPVTIARS